MPHSTRNFRTSVAELDQGQLSKISLPGQDPSTLMLNIALNNINTSKTSGFRTLMVCPWKIDTSCLLLLLLLMPSRESPTGTSSS